MSNKRLFIASLAAALVLVVIVSLNILQVVMFGLASTAPFIANFFFSNNIVLFYIGTLLQIVLTVGIVAAVLVMLKSRRPLLIAFTAAPLSLLFVSVLLAFLRGNIAVFLVLALAAAFGIFGIAGALTLKVKRIVLWPAAMLLVVGCTLAQPWLVNIFEYSEFQQEADSKFSKTLQAIDFTIYKPSYTPETVELTEPELNNYYFSGSLSNPYVGYKIDGVEVRQSALLEGQQAIMNFEDNCDISTIAFEMMMGDSIAQSEIERSRNDLTKCNSVAAMDSGEKIYYTELGQSRYYYVQLDGTNVVFSYDTINARSLGSPSREEMVAIIQSLQRFDKSKLIKGDY